MNEQFAERVKEAELLNNECPDDVATAWRNHGQTSILGLMDSDERRIKHLADLSANGEVNPHNPLMHLDLALFFDDNAKIATAQRVAEYATVPQTRIGKVERFIRRTIHRDIARAIKNDLVSK